jgi:hypothetical protein
LAAAARASAQRATAVPIKPKRRSVDRTGCGIVIELNDSIRDPAPCRRAILIIGSSEFVGACRTFVKRSTAIALEPQLCRPPIVDSAATCCH